MSISNEESVRQSSGDTKQHRAPDEEYSNPTPGVRHKYPYNNPLGINKYKHCPRGDDERVNHLLRNYSGKGISDRKEISKLLQKEGIRMSEATVARRRRTLDLIKKPTPTKGLTNRQKEIYILKHMYPPLDENGNEAETETETDEDDYGSDYSDRRRRRPRRISIVMMKVLREKEKNQYSKPLPEVNLYLMIIRDVWTGSWIHYQIIGCGYKDLVAELSYEYLHKIWKQTVIPEVTTIKCAYISRDFEAADILWDYLVEIISLDQAFDKIFHIELDDTIIKGVPEELSSWFNEVMRCWQNRKDNYNAADSDLRYRLLACELWRQAVWNELQNHGPGAQSFYVHCHRISLRVSDLGRILYAEADNKTMDLWDTLYEADWWNNLNPSDVWAYLENLLPLSKNQFILNDAGKWILTEQFVDPDDVPESPPPSSSIPLSEDPHSSSGPEAIETQYATSLTPFLPQESSIRGAYVLDSVPQAGPPYQLPSFSSYHEGANPIYTNLNSQPCFPGGFNDFH
ncbi:hypothetical protein M422DRAFT_252043 [Sphaerobolus stellatus SS14]|uniref:Clr5 domain-containing protein n=1 Tax=Sphaerobolus stellatus (strain SS14) TaxID=990650 RepID=A0A0C9VBY9_SPHS4|nr:hypothetical protein M422DRAFT_252043 [Sphaerobolus stellatus SS14]